MSVDPIQLNFNFSSNFRTKFLVPSTIFHRVNDLLPVTPCKSMYLDTWCIKHLDHTIFNSLRIVITKTGINTTRRCDLTSVLYGLIQVLIQHMRVRYSLRYYKLLINAMQCNDKFFGKD